MTTKRKSLVRFAHANPDLQDILLPLLKKGKDFRDYKTAEDAFMDKLAGCRGRLADLTKAFKRYEQQFKRDNMNWGFAGSMGYAEEKLTEALRHIRGH